QDDEEDQSGDDPTPQPQIPHGDEDQAGYQEESVGGVCDAVIEELDPPKGEGEVLGLHRASGIPGGIGDVAPDSGDRQQDMHELQQVVPAHNSLPDFVAVRNRCSRTEYAVIPTRMLPPMMGVKSFSSPRW